jgi:glutamyl-tRNA synthetase
MAARPELWPSVPLIKERIRTLVEAAPLVDFLFVDGPLEYADPAELVGEKMTPAQSAAALGAAGAALASLPAFDEASVEACLRAEVKRLGLKPRQFVSIVRVAVTGTRVSPPLFESIAILGQERAVLRLNVARNTVTELAEQA